VEDEFEGERHIALPPSYDVGGVRSDEEDGAAQFDFKYVTWSAKHGHHSYGLNTPAIITRDELRKLFALYCAIAATPAFP